jgi:hypothetical protein
MATTPNLTRKTLVAAKRESSYGSDAFGSAAVCESQLTTAASCAQLLWDEVNPVSLDSQIIEKQVVRGSFSKYTDLVGRQLYMLKLKTMLMTSSGGQHNHSDAGVTSGTGDSAGQAGEKGVPPFFGHLLRACALKETTNSSSSVVYSPYSGPSFNSATAYVFADTLRHKIAGLFGTGVFEGRAGEGIELSFDMKGKYSDPIASTIPSGVVYPVDAKELVENEGLTIAGHGGTPIVRSFRFDLGVEVVERRDFNSAEGLYGLWIIDRKPTLELVVEVEPLGTFDPWSGIDASSTYAVAFTHGSAADKLIAFSFPYAQLVNLNYQDDGGIRTYQMQFNLTSVSDDGEYSITFR